jgi:hypothetical protein
LYRQHSPQPKPHYGSRVDPHHPLAQGLVGCWLMNEGGGNTVFDSSGFGNHGNFSNGPLWVNGRSGSVISFDGNARWIDLPANTVGFEGLSEVSLITYVYLNNINANYVIYDNAITGDYFRFALYQNFSVANKLSISIRNTHTGDMGTRIILSSTPDTPLKKWVSVAITYSVRESFLRMYFDSDLVGETITNITAFTSTPAVNVRIANDVSSSPIPLNGMLAFTMLYNRALTSQEVVHIYANPYCFAWRPKKYWFAPISVALGKVPWPLFFQNEKGVF